MGFMSARTRPRRGPSILTALRGDINLRPRVDTGLAGGLREWLEDGLAPAAASLRSDMMPLVVDRWAASGSTAVGGTPVGGTPVGGVAASRAAAAGGAGTGIAGTGSVEPVPTVRSLHGSMLRALFAQVVTTGQIDDPIADAVGAMAITEHGHSQVTFYRNLPAKERDSLERQVRSEASMLLARWPSIPRAWLPRVGDAISFPLAGGRVVLRGMLDLALGPPPGDRSSACVVDVRFGERRSEHGHDRRFLALLETLRSGGAPFRVATYYSATGEIDIDDVTEPMLTGVVGRIIDTVLRRHPAPGTGRPCGSLAGSGTTVRAAA